jgi:gluconokinase
MIVVIMGVVGAGKTTVGQLLAQQLGWEFADADDFHSAASIDKIRRGIPLNDQDRSPWLRKLREQIIRWSSCGTNAVLPCSALKRSYREQLRAAPEVEFVYLRGSAKMIAERLGARHGHFADDKILASQFADLEEPETGLQVSIAQPPECVVAEIRQKLRLP